MFHVKPELHLALVCLRESRRGRWLTRGKWRSLPAAAVCCLTHTHQQTTPQTYRSHPPVLPPLPLHSVFVHTHIRSHCLSPLHGNAPCLIILFQISFMASLILQRIYYSIKQVANHIKDMAEANLTRTVQHVVWKKSFKSHDATLALGTWAYPTGKDRRCPSPHMIISGKLLIMNETLWSL